jgi:hypothetical protein
VSLEAAAFLCLIAATWLALVMARAMYRLGRRVARRASARLIDRAVDALLFVLLFRWIGPRVTVERIQRPPVLEGDDLFRACTLSRWQGHPARCRMCDGPLPERRERLCSSACDRKYRRNHVFSGPGGAREAALERDHDTCAIPGCGVQSTPERALEVHHAVTPALGRHGQIGCWHHLDGLRTLCGTHHDAETYGVGRRHSPRRRRGALR